MIYENCKITHDGSHYIAHIPRLSTGGGGYHPRRDDALLFDKYYTEAQVENIPDARIPSYIEERIMRDCDISDWISPERLGDLMKSKKRSEHLRYKRYEGKLFLTAFNWYVTFTYDDDKETPDSFERRLKRCFSNFKSRHDWRVVAVPEDGEEGGRRHWHCFLRVPEGEMVGELFLNSAFSKKRKRHETWTDNDYFNKRFGISVWKPITKEDLKYGGKLKSYLLKYLKKSGNKMYYSRDLPTELRATVNTECDVACTYFKHGYRSVLFDGVVEGDELPSQSVSAAHTFPFVRGSGFQKDKLIKKYGYPIVNTSSFDVLDKLFLTFARIKRGRWLKALPAPLT